MRLCCSVKRRRGSRIAEIDRGNRADPDLSLHLAMIECVMDLLQFYRTAYDETDEDQLIVKLLGPGFSTIPAPRSG